MLYLTFLSSAIQLLASSNRLFNLPTSLLSNQTAKDPEQAPAPGISVSTRERMRTIIPTICSFKCLHLWWLRMLQSTLERGCRPSIKRALMSPRVACCCCWLFFLLSVIAAAEEKCNFQLITSFKRFLDAVAEDGGGGTGGVKLRIKVNLWSDLAWSVFVITWFPSYWIIWCF